jgi:hypothetical protein
MVHNKVGLTIEYLTRPGYFVLIVLLMYLFIVCAILRRKLKITDRNSLRLVVLLPVIFFVIALIPPTMWRQYLAIPVPFLVIALAFPLSYLRRLTRKGNVSRQFKIASIFMAMGALLAFFSFPRVLVRVPIALVPETWFPIVYHKVSEEIVAKAKEPKQIFTLAPLLAIEGGGHIYTELSAGAIIYRIADYLTPRERQITHTAGPKNLPALIDIAPPSAVILNVEMPRLESLINEVIVQPDWEKEVYENGPIVYFSP